MYAHPGPGHRMWRHMGHHQGRMTTVGGQAGMMGATSGAPARVPRAGRGAGHGPMPAATSTVQPIDGGARVVLRPTEASDLAALRAHARWHAERMQSGQCWMWQPRD
jgi:hypothetical protein